jgi:AcrR family transcriptional regulator
VLVPKVVDHEQRREEIADALWSVVRRDGYAGVSVRTVAAETGMSTGALRHYFGTQADLIGFAMASLMERARDRVALAAGRAADLDGIVAVLEEVLPLDAERHAESEVWLALVAASRTETSLRPLADEAHRSLRGLCESVVRRLADDGGGEVDVTAETDRLHGLVDGLAVHGTLYPRLMPRTRIRAAIRGHVHELAARTGTV